MAYPVYEKSKICVKAKDLHKMEFLLINCKHDAFNHENNNKTFHPLYYMKNDRYDLYLQTPTPIDLASELLTSLPKC